MCSLPQYVGQSQPAKRREAMCNGSKNRYDFRALKISFNEFLVT